MGNLIFKITAILVGVCIVVMLFMIYNKMNSRYEVIQQANGFMLFDRYTNDVYEPDNGDWIKTDNNGRETTVKLLPK